MSIRGVPDSPFTSLRQDEGIPNPLVLPPTDSDAVAAQVRSSINKTVDRFFLHLSPRTIEFPAHAWKAYVTRVAHIDTKPLVAETTGLIRQALMGVEMSRNPKIYERESSQQTNLCLEFPITLIGKIGNPSLLNECEKIRIADALAGIHAALCTLSLKYLSQQMIKEAMHKLFISFDDLERYWKRIMCDIEKAASISFDQQKKFYKTLEENIESAWGDICVQNALDLTTNNEFRSHKERFLTNLLETYWISTHGDLTKIPPQDLVLLIENKHLIRRASLGKINALTSRQIESLATTFENIEQLSFGNNDTREDKEYGSLSTKALHSFSKLHHLTTLKLYRLSIKAQKQILSSIDLFPRLKNLHLEHFTITSDEMKIIGNLALTSLALVSGKLDSMSFKKYIIPDRNGKGGLSSLKDLELRDTLGVKALSPENALLLVARNPALEKLRLSSSHLSDSHLEALAKTTGNLHFLDLSECWNIGAGALSLIKSNPRITTLILHRDMGILPHISSISKETKNLLAFDIRHLGNAPLFFAKNNNNIRAASYIDDQLDDSSLIQFSENTPKMSSLTISLTQRVTPDGLESLAKNCRHLRLAGFIAMHCIDWRCLRSLAINAPHLEALSIETFRDQLEEKLLKEIIDLLPLLRWINIYPNNSAHKSLIASKNTTRASPITMTSQPHAWWIDRTITQYAEPE